ncbi:MAG: SMP-30/gluconolactonase/LRE family protein [Streptosporangiaceae bacterium]
MTATIQPLRVLAEGFACAESPRWHDGELYFSDMYGRAVVAVGMTGRSRVVAEIPDVPTGLGWLPDGRLLIATQKGRRVHRVEDDGRLSGSTVIARPALPPDGMSAVDRDGGIWIADPEGHAALRISAADEVTDQVTTERKCLAVALGGETGTTLFLCTTVSNDEHESVAQRASRIEVTEVAIGAAS